MIFILPLQRLWKFIEDSMPVERNISILFLEEVEVIMAEKRGSRERLKNV